MSQMSIPRVSYAPKDGRCYIIPQLEGEILSIPGSKAVFRILTSELQNDTFSVFSSDGAAADAPGFHHHNEAHDIFIVTKGYMQVWNDDQCRILGPGDFASVPPKIVHNPKSLGPITESFGLITPAGWVDFFRYVAESYQGILYPEMDHRDLKQIMIPKMMAAGPDKFDVHFHRDHVACEVTDWSSKDEILPDGEKPYYLKANTGPRWVLGGVLSRPFINTKQCAGKFAISSIESSSVYGAGVFNKTLRFPVDHLLVVLEGVLQVEVGGFQPTSIAQGETVFIAKNVAFSLQFNSKFVRFWSFATGNGIEALIQEAGSPHEGFSIPPKAVLWEEKHVLDTCTRLGIKIE